MDTRTLEYFLKIAEYQSITKAAADLHIAQPYLTRQLQSLEAEVGVPLFIREKKRLHITEEGRLFQEETRQILDLLDKTIGQMRSIHSGIGGKLFIGAIETAGTQFLPDWIEGFRKLYPAVTYSLWAANSEDVIARLAKGLLDIALIREPYDEDQFEGIRITEENWIAIVPADSPFAKSSEPLTLDQLAQAELMVPAQRTRQISGWFQEKGLKARILCEFTPLMNGVAMAEKGLGISILPASAARSLDKARAVCYAIAPPQKTCVDLIWRRDGNLSAAARHFTDYVRKLQGCAGSLLSLRLPR